MVVRRQKNAAAESDNEDVDVFAARPAGVADSDDSSSDDEPASAERKHPAAETPSTLAPGNNDQADTKPLEALDAPRHGRYFHHDERSAATEEEACRDKRINQGLYSHWDEDEITQWSPAKQMAEEDGQTLLAQGGKRRYLYDPLIDRNMAWEHDKFNDLNRGGARGRASPRGRGSRGRGRGRGRAHRGGAAPANLISS